MEILDSEKRRARNLIWNAAGDYTFEPDFKVYDKDGRADLYWNSIIGAVRKNYGPGAFDDLFKSFKGCLEEQLYEQLVWLGLENAVYQREAAGRPALPALRERYARRMLALDAPTVDRMLDVLQTGHLRRCLGQDPALEPRDLEMLDTLEFSGELDAAAITDAALAFLRKWLRFVPGETQEAEQKLRRRRKFILGRKRRCPVELPTVRAFGYGYGEHPDPSAGADTPLPQRRLTDLSVAQSKEALRNYVASYFGPPLYEPWQIAALETELCQGDHLGCHLYYAQGSDYLDPSIRGYVGSQRRAAIKQMQRNRDTYEADSVRNRIRVSQLTARIRNAMLAYLQPTVVRAASGVLDAGRVWRGVYLDDSRVFTKLQQSDPGQLSVDLLLDASTSQVDRQAAVAAQGYMIAESLTRCGIPVRVSSFCSLSGYTVLTRYRDYQETDKNEAIFHYFTTGCNRDGLAIRALARDLEDSPCEHKLVILLSDTKPNDVIKLHRSDSYVDYAGQNGVENTAMEVRALTYRDVNVICVFTGNDSDVPAAGTIYGRNFARIRSLDQFADTVGTFIQNQIRSM